MPSFPAKSYFGSYNAALKMHPDAPVLSGLAGGLITLLNAVLVDGFAIKSIQSITLTSNVATVVSAGHGYVATNINRIAITGCSTAAMNTEWEIATIVDANTYTINAVMADFNDSVSTMSSKFPSLGWTRPFGDAVGNVVVYRSADTSGNRPYLRIDAATAGVAKVSYYTSMTDINTGTNRVPTTSQSANGISWCYHAYSKNNIYTNTDGSIMTWSIVGTSKFFYFNSVFGANFWQRSTKWFGEFNPLGSNTTQNVICRGGTNNFATGTNYIVFYDTYNPLTEWTIDQYTVSGYDYTPGNFINFDLSKLSVSRPFFFIPGRIGNTAPGNNMGYEQNSWKYTPVKCNNKIMFTKPIFTATTTDGLLGEMPGMAACEQNYHHYIDQTAFFTTDTNTGKRYFIFWLGSKTESDIQTALTVGAWYFDIDTTPTTLITQ